jgi:hypothetical protein
MSHSRLSSVRRQTRHKRHGCMPTARYEPATQLLAIAPPGTGPPAARPDGSQRGATVPGSAQWAGLHRQWPYLTLTG